MIRFMLGEIYTVECGMWSIANLEVVHRTDRVVIFNDGCQDFSYDIQINNQQEFVNTTPHCKHPLIIAAGELWS